VIWLARAGWYGRDALVGILIAADGGPSEPTYDGADNTADERRALPGGGIECRGHRQVAKRFDRGRGIGPRWPGNGRWFDALSIEGRVNASDQGHGSQKNESESYGPVLM
jgi:hypothetical protein